MDEKKKTKGGYRMSGVGWALRAPSKPQIDIIPTFSSLFWQDTARLGAVFRANKEPEQQLTKLGTKTRDQRSSVWGLQKPGDSI